MMDIFFPTDLKPIPPDARVETHRGVRGVFIVRDGRKVFCELHEDGQHIYRPRKTYHVYLTIEGKRKLVNLNHSNREYAEIELGRIRDKLARGKLGLPDAKPNRQPLTERLDDWKRSIIAGGSTAKHATESARLVGKVCSGSASSSSSRT